MVNVGVIEVIKQNKQTKIMAQDYNPQYNTHVNNFMLIQTNA